MKSEDVNDLLVRGGFYRQVCAAMPYWSLQLTT
jgi:hypothetical protein